MELFLYILPSGIPELNTVIGEASSNLSTSDEAGMPCALRQCFQALMTCPTEIIQEQLSLLVERQSSLGMLLK